MTCPGVRSESDQGVPDMVDRPCDHENLESSHPLFCVKKKRCHDCERCKQTYRCGGRVPTPKCRHGLPKAANDFNANDPIPPFEYGAELHLVAGAATSLSKLSQPNDAEEPPLTPRNPDCKKRVSKEGMYIKHDSNIDEEAYKKQER